jgi:hypothetical protein
MPEQEETMWPVEVKWGSTYRTFMFPLSVLGELKRPPVGVATPPVADYKRDVRAYRIGAVLEAHILRGAWIYEPGKIICDKAELV